MALGERFTRSAVACEFSLLPVSRRRLLRPAAGFRESVPALRSVATGAPLSGFLSTLAGSSRGAPSATVTAE